MLDLIHHTCWRSIVSTTLQIKYGFVDTGVYDMLVSNNLYSSPKRSVAIFHQRCERQNSCNFFLLDFNYPSEIWIWIWHKQVTKQKYILDCATSLFSTWVPWISKQLKSSWLLCPICQLLHAIQISYMFKWKKFWTFSFPMCLSCGAFKHVSEKWNN